MEFLQKHKISIIGSMIGALAGYMYYHFIGCASGNCMITSNPFISTIYGGVMGHLVINIFPKREEKKTE